MQEILKFLYNAVDIEGNFIAISETAIMNQFKIDKNILETNINTFLSEKLILLVKCQTGRNFYCLTKRGEKKLSK